MHHHIDLENLRTTDYDFAGMQQQQQQQQPQQPLSGSRAGSAGEGYNMPSDLDMFANTQFFDFEMSEMQENSPIFADYEGGVAVDEPHQTVYSNEFENVMTNFPGYPDSHKMGGMHTAHQQQHPRNAYSSSRASISGQPSSDSSPLRTLHNSAVDIKKAGMSSPNLEANTEGGEVTEEAARVAAEEDKRRRNTAASARFRVKKKQREQALEKTAKEMTDRVTELEGMVAKLEMENKILKELITEKSGKAVDPAEMQRKILAASPKPSPSPTSEQASRSSRSSNVKVEKSLSP